MILLNQTCSQCGYKNRPASKHCGYCNSHLDGQYGDESFQYAQPVRPADLVPNPKSVRQSDLITHSNMNMLPYVAHDLDYLWNEFNRIRAAQEQGNWTWKVIRRHVAAYRLKQKVGVVYDRLEYAYLDTYVEAHQQTLKALLRLRKQQFDHDFQIREQRHIEEIESRKSLLYMNLDDEASRRYLARRDEVYRSDQTWDYRRLIGELDMYFGAVARIERGLSEGTFGLLDNDKKGDVLYRLVSRVEERIFAPGGNGYDRDGFSDGPGDLADLW